jgi:hypothetical protein
MGERKGKKGVSNTMGYVSQTPSHKWDMSKMLTWDSEGNKSLYFILLIGTNISYYFGDIFKYVTRIMTTNKKEMKHCDICEVHKFTEVHFRQFPKVMLLNCQTLLTLNVQLPSSWRRPPPKDISTSHLQPPTILPHPISHLMILRAEKRCLFSLE